MEVGRISVTLSHAIVYSLIVVSALTCSPAEEDRPYDIKYNMTSIPRELRMFMWMKDGQLAFECTVATGECSHNDIPWLKASTQRVDDSLVLNIHFPRVTRQQDRNSEGVWSLHTHISQATQEIFYTCNLKVYAKPNEPHCETNVSADELLVKCNTDKTYPRSQLAIQWQGGQVLATCRHTIVSFDPVYYGSECSTQLPKTRLEIRHNNLTLTVYPNVTGSQTDISLGVSRAAYLNRVVERHCVEDDHIIQCTCHRLEPLGDRKEFIWKVKDKTVSSKASMMYTYQKDSKTTFGSELGYITCQELNEQDNESNTSVTGVDIALAITLVFTALMVIFLCLIVSGRPKSISLRLFNTWRHSLQKKLLDNLKNEYDNVEMTIRNPEKKIPLFPNPNESRENYSTDETTIGNTEEKRPLFPNPNESRENYSTDETTIGNPEEKRPLFPNPNESTENDSTDGARTTMALCDSSPANENGLKRSIDCVVLMMGTHRSNKDILTNVLLDGKETPTEKNNRLRWNYLKDQDKYIKLIDLITDVNNQTELKRDLQLSKHLCPEGYNSFIVVLTVEDFSDFDGNNFKKCLEDVFEKPVAEYLSLIVTYKTKYDVPTSLTANYTQIKKLIPNIVTKDTEIKNKENFTLTSSIQCGRLVLDNTETHFSAIIEMTEQMFLYTQTMTDSYIYAENALSKLDSSGAVDETLNKMQNHIGQITNTINKLEKLNRESRDNLVKQLYSGN